MKSILVLHGPNLDRLGTREPDLYGEVTLDKLNRYLIRLAEQAGAKLVCKQSNSESVLIDVIHQAMDEKVTHIIINPAAYTHTSIALRDALVLTRIPFIEVHLSNIFAREPFRQHSYFSDVAQGVISGLGVQSYIAALNTLLYPLSESE